MNDERDHKLHAALERLPDEMRRCVLLRFVQGFEESEVAILMRIPLEMVRQQLYQARQRLQAAGVAIRGSDHGA